MKNTSKPMQKVRSKFQTRHLAMAAIFATYYLLSAPAHAQAGTNGGLSKWFVNITGEASLIFPIIMWLITTAAGIMAVVSLWKAATAKDKQEDPGKHWTKVVIFTLITVGAAFVAQGATSISGKDPQGGYKYDASEWN